MNGKGFCKPININIITYYVIVLIPTVREFLSVFILGVNLSERYLTV